MMRLNDRALRPRSDVMYFGQALLPESAPMINVLLHTQGGTVWALFRCKVCHEVQKHALHDATIAPVKCKRCGAPIDLARQVADAVSRSAYVTPRDALPATAATLAPVSAQAVALSPS